MEEAVLAHPPAPDCFERLEAYARLTLEASRRLSLVSRRDPAAQILLNILDSLPLACLFAWRSEESAREGRPRPAFLLDAGSGSGVPGVPAAFFLAGAPASFRLYLVESRESKAGFLRKLVEVLGVSSCEVYQGRLEEPEFAPWLEARQAAGATGLLCARALAGVDKVLHWCRPIEPRLEGALLIKGTPGLNREWLREKQRWDQQGWGVRGVFAFFPGERLVHHLWLLPQR